MNTLLRSPQQLTTARQANRNDLDFVARMAHEASIPPFQRSAWDEIVKGTGTDSLSFVRAMLAADANSWGRVEDFIIIEDAGTRVAAASGFSPGKNADPRELDLTRLDAIANELGWNPKQLATFRNNYEDFWPLEFSLECMKPQAPWIIETVGVESFARGRGVGQRLIEAVCDEGRRRGYVNAGISVILGNENALRLYERCGFERCITYHTGYFHLAFPGFVKLRRPL